MKRGRGGRVPSELDWFAEDPWLEPDLVEVEDDDDEVLDLEPWEMEDDGGWEPANSRRKFARDSW